MAELFQADIETLHGAFSLIFHRGGICELLSPGDSPRQAYPRHALPWPRLVDDLNRYFRGVKVSWDGYPLDMGAYPPFFRRVLEAVREIPYGETRTYREAAELAGSPKAWRAAGQALKANRHPFLIP